jgi:rsbT co-antagonist protein RsbR
MTSPSKLPEILRRNESEILNDWMRYQLSSTVVRGNLIRENELREQSSTFLAALREALESGKPGDTDGPAWSSAREFVTEMARTRARQGFTPVETAMFIFSLKLPIFARLRQEYADDAASLGAEIWTATEVVDRLGLFATDTYQRAREEVIARQQQELLELSTPVVNLWKDILALPLIGTLDSARTQVVMESLLHKIVETGAAIAIIDITGVPTVDTLVAQHLLKTVAAARLMGADCIISGIRPQIAQTIVHLGVDLSSVSTKATLADAFLVALKRTQSSLPKGSNG